jgi:hypothetical protein
MRFLTCKREISVTKVHEGECNSDFVEENEDNCNLLCNGMGTKICGSDGQTYSGECMMRLLTCKNEISVTKSYDGPCVSGDMFEVDFGPK